MAEATSLTIIVPTYRREQVLVDTIARLLKLEPSADEILIIDQTAQHMPTTELALSKWVADGAIERISLKLPSVTAAMNCGLKQARNEIVLFLDDDIIPERNLVAAHIAGHLAPAGRRRLIAGRVIQPWQEGVDYSGEAHFHFASPRSAEIDQFMGGNFSLRRTDALALGGFDENFVKVAFRFEAEFAYRWRRGGGAIHFAPDACIHHLKAMEGGTRSFGAHLTTVAPSHSVGAYYCMLRTWSGASSVWALVVRPVKAVTTRFHLRHPWRILPTLVSELLGMIWALGLAARGPALIDMDRTGDNV